MSPIAQASSGLRRGLLLLLAAALAAVLVAHLRGIGGAFLSDDYAHLGWVHDASERGTLWSWTLSRFWLPLGSGNYAYRPLAFATYALDWIAYGANTTGWHVTNLILHGVNAALAFVVAARWLGARAPNATAAGLVAAGVLAAFPFAGEVSFWPVGRFDLLACLFSLLYLSTLPFGARPVPPWQTPAAPRVARLRAAFEGKRDAAARGRDLSLLRGGLPGRRFRRERPRPPALRAARDVVHVARVRRLSRLARDAVRLAVEGLSGFDVSREPRGIRDASRHGAVHRSRDAGLGGHLVEHHRRRFARAVPGIVLAGAS